MNTRNGIILRARVIPPDPATAYQTTIRAYFATLAARWSSTLTTPQRRGWDLYASHVKRTNALADHRDVGGIAMYIRSNVPRLQASLAILDGAPTTFDLSYFTPFTTLTAYPDPDRIRLHLHLYDAWRRELGAALLIFASRPVPPATNFFRGGYRFATSVPGQPTGPLSLSVIFKAPFPFGRNIRLFVRMQIARSDARYSVSQTLSVDT